MPTPLKRHKSLQPISREHHHGLLLAWKIREGFKLEITVHRMKDYVDWFWKHHLQDHFAFEEQYIFPILGMDDELVIRAMKEHEQLENLFHSKEKLKQTLLQIEKMIVSHIRFEERKLFEQVQKIATEQQMQFIEENHDVHKIDHHWEDEFWIKPKG